MFLLLVTVLLISILYILRKAIKTNNYWNERGVKNLKALPFLGNMSPIIFKSKTSAEFIQHLYWAFPEERYCGFFQLGKPMLLLRDLELIKSVTIKNFEHFTDHVGFTVSDVDPLFSKNLFSSQGERWRDLRQTLSPVFTSSKMRNMFNLMDECARELVTYFKEQDKEIVKVEMKDLFSRYANDVIASTAFGIKCDSFRSKDNEFMLAGRELTDFSGSRKFVFLFYGLYPKLSKFFNLKIVRDKVGNFFRAIISETIKLREQNSINRPDMIQILMMARNGKLRFEEQIDLPQTGFAEVEESTIGKTTHKQQFLTDEDITAQALIFFLGGFDTSSSLLCFASHELAVNPHIQQRLREEIQTVDQLSYEKLASLKYLDMVMCEALRKWPQGVWLDRKCTKTFEIEPERPGEHPLTVNEGDACWIPAYAFHHDPTYFPNPEIFDPERFNDENRKSMNTDAYMPFGIGPRNCIGSRFALLEGKIILYHLLKNFEIITTEKTQIPLKVSKETITMTAEKGFHLGLKKICK